MSGPTRTDKIYIYFLLTMLLSALYLTYVIAGPFLHTIVFSGVVSLIFSPLFNRIQRRTGGRRTLAALITVLIIVVCIGLPLFFLTFGLVIQARDTFQALNVWARETDFAKLLDAHQLDQHLVWLREQLPFVQFDASDIQARLLEFSRNLGQIAVEAGRQLFTNTARLIFHLLLLVFIVFYFLRDGRDMVEKLRYLCPLRTEQEDLIIENIQRVARSVLVGTLFIAALQGLLGGIGLAIVGLPALFWGGVMALAALVPVVGTGLVWAPAVGWLLIQGQTGWAIFLALWCGVLVTSVDTVLRPLLLREASQVSTFFVFLAVLGGISAFGFAGILYGPLTLTFVMVMLRIYGEEYRDMLSDRCNCQPPSSDSES
ncbi:AI-2E family transporter [Desulfovibrio aminophilus]|uniref:AI-2E family transporter n=1 Tax=Desulfovibrio aminophilus TaxID=81425 RepID=UPI0033933F72